MKLPLKLNKFLSSAKDLLDKNPKGEILFSEGTYELEIKDGNETFWPFLQIKDDGEVLDVFCSCEEMENLGCCHHITAGYLKIFKNQKEALHVTFRSSFWRSLFSAVAKRFSCDDRQLELVTKDNELVVFGNIDGFSVKINVFNKILIDKIINFFQNKKDVEKSIKYSSLSFDDMEDFKRGHLRNELEFEFSAFSDVAKEMFFLQESGEKYNVDFISEKENEVPSKINVLFENNLSMEISFSEKDLKEIIPSLNTVKSNVRIFKFEDEAIEKIVYDREKSGFEILLKEGVVQKISDLRNFTGKEIGDYLFIPGKGFLSKKRSMFLEKRVFSREKAGFLFEDYLFLLERYLRGEKISFEKRPAKYHLFIDGEKNLHIRNYLFEADDFFKKNSYFWGPWGYIDGKGFFLLDGLMFEGRELVISKDLVSEFVSAHRVWLQNIEGFKTKFGHFKENLIYFFTKESDLKFGVRVEGPEKVIDYGLWVYLEGKGFYSKKEIEDYPIKPSVVVKGSEIEKFIKEKKEDLKQIIGFFTEENPIKKMGFEIRVNENNSIEVSLEKELNEGYSLDDLMFFNSFIYIKNKGFFELPSNWIFPKEYLDKKEISEEKEKIFFVEYELNRLKPAIVYLDKRLQLPEYIRVKLDDIKRDKKKYLLELYYVSNLGKISAAEFFDAFLNGGKYLFLSIGLINTEDPRFSWGKELSKSQLLVKKNVIKLSFLQWLKLSIFETVKKPRGKTDKALKAADVFDKLINLQTDVYLDISMLKAKLRSYQILGVKWLWFLYCYGLSGLLCDEMGLGKTHQAMALLAAARNYNADEKVKFLVVCPTSVIYHWEELLKKFLPGFKVLLFHGSGRKIKEDFDVLLTSYGLVRGDDKLLSSIKFEIAIYDEMQIAKNYHSKTYKSLRKIKYKMLLGLTGTPIENRLKELKSLFDLALPNYLPSEAVFKNFFVDPIEKENDKEKKVLLAKLIKPFILRRKKAEVLSDLPEKIEEISYCDLSEDQKRLYKEFIDSSKKEIVNELKDEGKKINYTHIFSVLTKLKQICDHPVLINKDFKNSKNYSSGKWELLLEILREAKASKRKIVIFSQYLDMLKIIETHLKSSGVKYAMLTGATTNRKEEILKFREDPKCEVFLASLLAAGVGIDLSCASVVIHYDRWWNPAKENQATDRVHRLGQNRGVQVFKLVTKNTIEERINEIIEKKKNLIEETIGNDDSSQIKMFSRKELLSIFQEINS